MGTISKASKARKAAASAGEEAGAIAAVMPGLLIKINKKEGDRVQQDETNAVLVAEGADGQVIGWVQVYVRPLVVDDLNAEVGGLVVDERTRSQGVGQRLMEEAEAWARAHGCEAVNVRSNVIRERAHHFYEAIGYRRIKTQLTLRKALAEVL